MAPSAVPDQSTNTSRREFTSINFVAKDEDEYIKLTYTEPDGTPFVCTPQITPDASFTKALDSLLPEILEIITVDKSLNGHPVRSARFEFENGVLMSVGVSIELWFTEINKGIKASIPSVPYSMITQSLTCLVQSLQNEASRHLAKLPRYEQGDLFAVQPIGEPMPNLELMAEVLPLQSVTAKDLLASEA